MAEMLALFIAVAPIALNVQPARLSVSRRQVLLGGAVAFPPLTAAARAPSPAKEYTLPELSAKASALRIYAATAGRADVPLEARRYRLLKKKEAVLLPLLAKMTAAAPNLNLPAEQQKRAELLPQCVRPSVVQPITVLRPRAILCHAPARRLMMGHLLEFDEAVEKARVLLPPLRPIPPPGSTSPTHPRPCSIDGRRSTRSTPRRQRDRRTRVDGWSGSLRRYPTRPRSFWG